MKAVILSPTAQREVDEIIAYIAADNPTAASHWLDVFESALDLLSHMPEVGRPRDELRKGLRGLALGNYILVYRQSRGQVEIVRVVHGMRDLPPLFDHS